MNMDLSLSSSICPSAVAPVDHVRLKKKWKRLHSTGGRDPPAFTSSLRSSPTPPPTPSSSFHHLLFGLLLLFSVSLLSLSAFLSQLVSSLSSSKNIGLCFLPSREKYIKKKVLRSLFSGIKYTQPLLFLSQYLRLSSHHNLCSSPPEVKPACSSQ